MTHTHSATFFLFFLYLASKPFYLLPSGMPQFADWILAPAILLVAVSIRTRLPPPHRAISAWAFAFAAYTLLTNAVWAITIDSYDMVFYGVFYSFNALAVFMVLKLAALDSDRLIDFVAVGVVVGALSQVVYISVFGDTAAGGRSLGSFNNPNQLGYYGLLCASILVLLTSATRIAPTFLFLGIGASISLTLFSLSKAAIISTAILLLLHFFRKPAQIVFLVVVGALAAGLSEQAFLFDNIQSRFESIGAQRDDSAEGRGYDRIVNHPEHLAFGAGEAGYSRFSDFTGELHSTLGTVVFSYGLVGLALFGIFVFRIFAASSLRYFFYSLPAFLYGVTHQGLRFTFFWILLALIPVVYKISLTKEARPSR